MVTGWNYVNLWPIDSPDQIPSMIHQYFAYICCQSNVIQATIKKCKTLGHFGSHYKSLHMWTANLRKKSDVSKAIKNFEAMAQIQHGATIKRWQINQGGEFINSDLMDTLRGLGIVIEQSVPLQHQQNGWAERAIRTIMEKAQCLHFTACLPQSWWEFCINHTVYLINQTPIACLSWLTPMESLIKVKPDLPELCVFGCGAYVFLPEEVRVNKLAPKSELMTYIRYETGVMGWRFM